MSGHPVLTRMQVAQLIGYVSEQSAYHHGEASLAATIVNLAQHYVGSNNVNLLMPEGQFGTRHEGGKDHASARYIFTKPMPLARAVFNPADDPLLNAQRDDGALVEPEWYLPVVPTILLNGTEGIGTGESKSTSGVFLLTTTQPKAGVHPYRVSTLSTW